MVFVATTSCGQVYVPPRQVCGRCFVSMSHWVELSPRGTLRLPPEAYPLGKTHAIDGHRITIYRIASTREDVVCPQVETSRSFSFTEKIGRRPAGHYNVRAEIVNGYDSIPPATSSAEQKRQGPCDPACA